MVGVEFWGGGLVCCGLVGECFIEVVWCVGGC